MSSSSLFTILENIQESIALAVDMAKNQRENETGESSYIPLEFHLKNNHHQSNLAKKNQVKESIHDLQRENENMRKINLTLKKKIIDFEKSNQLLSHHILLTNVRNINKLNQKLSKQIITANSKMFTQKLQIRKLKRENQKLKRENFKISMGTYTNHVHRFSDFLEPPSPFMDTKNCVEVKSENINPEDYVFENEKVKMEEVQLLKNEIKTEDQ